MITQLLLPADGTLSVDATLMDSGQTTLFVHTMQPEACCPVCQHAATRVHSRYERTVAELPCSYRQVRLKLTVRRFFCPNNQCHRRTFTEQLFPMVAPYARRSCRLTNELMRLALTEGGEQGARTARRQGMPTSADTLLRLARSTLQKETPSPRALGVDDWAWRKGQTYGTILVDLERHKTVDLLPDCRADSLAEWLARHPGVEVIGRDRAGAYAEGASRGAPQAVQVADRFHLHVNLREALERLLDRHHSGLRAATKEPTRIEKAPQSPVPGVLVPSTSAAAEETPLTRSEALRRERRVKRVTRYEEVLSLRHQGESIRGIARHLKMGRGTVRRYLQADGFPERAAPRRRASILDPYVPYMTQRLTEGFDNGVQLWREIRAHGYPGCRSLVSRWVVRHRSHGPGHDRETRKVPSAKASPALQPRRRLSARQASWLLFRDEEVLSNEERTIVQRLVSSSEEIERAYRLAGAFRALLKNRTADALDDWLAAAEQSQVKELASFAKGLRKDEPAVRAALALGWSNGQVEGQINRLKLIKRQMYGRAKFDLLRARVLAA